MGSGSPVAPQLRDPSRGLLAPVFHQIGWAGSAILGGMSKFLPALFIAIIHAYRHSWVAAIGGTVLVVALVIVAANVVPPIGWQAEASETRTLLGILLGSQAAIVALTFVAAIFVLESIATKQDADDHMYTAYVDRSWMFPIFLVSVGAVFVTGALLIAEAFGSAGAPYLVIGAAVAGAVNLMLPVLLFWRMIRLVQPSVWQTLRREVHEHNAWDGLQVSLRTYLRQERSTDPDV